MTCVFGSRCRGGVTVAHSPRSDRRRHPQPCEVAADCHSPWRRLLAPVLRSCRSCRRCAISAGRRSYGAQRGQARDERADRSIHGRRGQTHLGAHGPASRATEGAVIPSAGQAESALLKAMAAHFVMRTDRQRPANRGSASCSANWSSGSPPRTRHVGRLQRSAGTRPPATRPGCERYRPGAQDRHLRVAGIIASSTRSKLPTPRRWSAHRLVGWQGGSDEHAWCARSRRSTTSSVEHVQLRTPAAKLKGICPSMTRSPRRLSVSPGRGAVSCLAAERGC